MASEQIPQREWPPGFIEAGKLLIKWTAERLAAEKAAQAAASQQKD